MKIVKASHKIETVRAKVFDRKNSRNLTSIWTVETFLKGNNQIEDPPIK